MSAFPDYGHALLELGRNSLAQAMPQTPGGTAINDLGADDAPQA